MRPLSWRMIAASNCPADLTGNPFPADATGSMEHWLHRIKHRFMKQPAQYHREYEKSTFMPV